ncbi:MAG: hypothetical protein O3B13_22590 [Planctomycetota bacterium]|nr:hypothetical protein [Planctomycetota bacterium]MDA1165896.1 hypothetical protein [Planctomycetota bacterium]
MQKGFLNRALRVAAIATMLIVTLCVASFGLSRLRPAGVVSPPGVDQPATLSGHIGGRLSDDDLASENRDDRSRSDGSDPLAQHIDRLGKRLEEIAGTVERERSTQCEIARLADSMQAVRQQADLSGTRLQQEIGSLRVSSEVELRDLNRQINSVASSNQRLTQQMTEHRVGILTALDRQRTEIDTRVARLEGSLNNVNTELADLRDFSRPAELQAAGSKALVRSPLGHNHAANDFRREHSAWEEPVVPGSISDRTASATGNGPITNSATSAGWKVSPMSHFAPAPLADSTTPILPVTLPAVPSAVEKQSFTRQQLPNSNRQAISAPLRSPLRSTLAPTSAGPAVRVPEPAVRVPEIVEPSPAVRLPSVPRSHHPSVDNISHSAQLECESQREFDIDTTVIHVAASRPVDVEPAGVRILNPELSTTPYGQPWTHTAVAHELFRQISLRTDASIAGRQTTTVRSGGTELLTIGSSCPHCNQVHGFEAGDHLLLKAGSGCDSVQRFHVSGKLAGSGNSLESLPDFELTPMTDQTYVISEESVEGTVEESVTAGKDNLMAIHGVLTPVAGPQRTKVSVRLMQRLVVITFKERNALPAESKAIAASTTSRIVNPGPQSDSLPLPVPNSPEPAVANQLKPVERDPIFLPQPKPSASVRTTGIRPNIEQVSAETLSSTVPPAQQAKHRTIDGTCEICSRKHDKREVEKSGNEEISNPLTLWFHRVRGESTGTESGETDASFSVSGVKPATANTSDTDKPHQRRSMQKPGKRRPVR